MLGLGSHSLGSWGSVWLTKCHPYINPNRNRYLGYKVEALSEALSNQSTKDDGIARYDAVNASREKSRDETTIRGFKKQVNQLESDLFAITSELNETRSELQEAIEIVGLMKVASSNTNTFPREVADIDEIQSELKLCQDELKAQLHAEIYRLTSELSKATASKDTVEKALRILFLALTYTVPEP